MPIKPKRYARKGTVVKKRAYKKRALGVRGGFTPSLPPGRTGRSVGKPARPTSPNAQIGRQIGRVIGSLGTAAFYRYGPTVLKMLENYVEDGLKSRGRRVKNVDATDNQPFTRQTPYVLQEESSSKFMQGSKLGAFTSKKFSTSIRVGHRSTKALNMAAKTYGTYDVEKFNSISQFQSAGGIALPDRVNTQATYGFNQKAFLFFTENYCTHKGDLASAFLDQGVSNPYQFPQNQYERLYGLVKEAKTRIKVSNSNQYYPVNVKMHLVRIDDRLTQPGIELANLAFDTNLAGNQAIGKVPQRYQYSGISSILPHYAKVLVSRRCNLSMSSDFKRKATVINTTSKRLNPGDVWNFNIHESFGPGVDVQKLALENSAAPVYHAVVAELVGVECEAIGQNVTPDPATAVQNTVSYLGTYIGTSPGEINFEGLRSVTFVANPRALYKQENEGLEPSAATKVFIEKPVTTKEFNINHNLIGLPGEEGKELFIPVMTDKDLRFSESATGTSANAAAMMTTNQILQQLRNILDPPSSATTAFYAEDPFEEEVISFDDLDTEEKEENFE